MSCLLYKEQVPRHRLQVFIDSVISSMVVLGLSITLDITLSNMHTHAFIRSCSPPNLH